MLQDRSPCPALHRWDGTGVPDGAVPSSDPVFRPTIIIIIIIWFGDTVTVTHLTNVIQTRKCEPCQLNKLTTPFPAGGFPPDTASSTRPKAQSWPQFNRHALDNNG